MGESNDVQGLNIARRLASPALPWSFASAAVWASAALVESVHESESVNGTSVSGDNDRNVKTYGVGFFLKCANTIYNYNLKRR